jgi:hypothetical protein
MIKKTLLVVALAASSLGAVTLPAVAAPRGVVVDVAPPAARVEAVPAARRGYAWVPGYWNWAGRRHVWVPGNWVRERRGYVYAEPRWVERDGRWALNRGGWNRGDRDHDGVPNNRDRHPDNPRRP